MDYQKVAKEARLGFNPSAIAQLALDGGSESMFRSLRQATQLGRFIRFSASVRANARRIRIGQIIGLVLFGVAVVSGQMPSVAQPSCAEYHELRVMYLLHCCGDVEMTTYPGPRFRAPTGDERRAGLAIQEINAAMHTCAGDPKKQALLALKLDEAGARLMRAHAIASGKGEDDRGARLWVAALNAAHSAAILRKFVLNHPTEAAAVWPVIEHWLDESGGAWQALGFLARLPAKYYSSGDVAKIKGDLYMRLGYRQLAADSYATWIEAHNGQPSTCGNEAAFANLASLRNSGFKVPVITPNPFEAGCIDSGFGYYVILGSERKHR